MGAEIRGQYAYPTTERTRRVEETPEKEGEKITKEAGFLSER
jgi:hypothetical protein